MTYNNSLSDYASGHKENVMKYLRYWHYFVIAIVLGVGGAFLYLQSTEPLFKVSSTLLIQDDAKGDGLLKGTAFSDLEMFKTSRTADNEMEILRSRDLIYKVLKSNSMDVAYSYDKALRRQQLYGVTLPIQVIVEQVKKPAYLRELLIEVKNQDEYILTDEGRIYTYQFNQIVTHPEYRIKVVKGPAFHKESKKINVRLVNLHRLAELYSLSKLVIMPTIKDANTIYITLLDEVPQRGIDILTKLIETYNLENVSSKNMMALNTIKFIDGKLKYLSKDLSEVEQQVENYKRNNSITELGADAQWNLQTSGNYDQQLATTNVQLSLVQSIISYLNQTGGRFEMVPTTLGLTDPILVSLTQKYNELQIERQRLLRTNSEDNPLVINVNDQLLALKSNLLENLNVIRKGLLLERNNSYRKSAQFEARLRSVPGIERGLLEKSREQSVKTALYHYLLQKREETELSLSATIPTTQVIDRPNAGSNQAKPKVQLVYLFGLIIGFLSPASVIYIKQKLNTRITDIGDVQLLTGGARILGELSHKEKGNTIVVQKDQSTTISELFKYIRSNLNFLEARKGSKIFLITSSKQGEGKTFFTVNLGITLAMANKKVVLLEFDLRKPDLLNSMKMNQGIGLSEYLDDEGILVDDILVQSPGNENLWIIGCGAIPKNPSELLLNDKTSVLFHELKRRFDFIIIDTPPVGQVSDTFSLAPYADASIYLIRYNYTNKAELAIFHEICENQRLKNPMLVFNDAKKENRNVYRYGRYSYAT